MAVNKFSKSVKTYLNLQKWLRVKTDLPGELGHHIVRFSTEFHKQGNYILFTTKEKRQKRKQGTNTTKQPIQKHP